MIGSEMLAETGCKKPDEKEHKRKNSFYGFVFCMDLFLGINLTAIYS